jgi:hypothetical protein
MDKSVNTSRNYFVTFVSGWQTVTQSVYNSSDHHGNLCPVFSNR